MATAEYVAQQRDMIESLRDTQPLENAFADMGDMISSSIEQWTQGLGSLVEAWVLYGTAGPDAMRKMTAQVLASLAAQAAAKALFYTAEGIVALFLDPPLAGAFFSAAAIMGHRGSELRSLAGRSPVIHSRKTAAERTARPSARETIQSAQPNPKISNRIRDRQTTRSFPAAMIIPPVSSLTPSTG
jgi:hypothetical protein